MRATGVVCQSLFFMSCLAFLPCQLESQPSDLPSKTSVTVAGAEHVGSAAGHRTVSLGELPLQFEENVGQAAGQARFLARGEGYTLLINPEGLVLKLSQKRDNSVPGLSIHLLGTQRGELSGREQTETRTNYYIGKDPSRWHLNVRSYRSVAYPGIYKGIDLVYHGSGNRLEYDFVVSPEADPSQVRMRFDGLKPALQGKDLSFGTDNPISIRALNAFQVIGGEKKAVDAAWQIQGDQASILLGPYDRQRELIIDPIISYGTYIGGSGSESAVSILPAATAGVFYVALASSSASTTEPEQEAGQTAATNPNTTGTDTLILELDATGGISPTSSYAASSSVTRMRPSPNGIILGYSVTLSADPMDIEPGGTSTLTWSSNDMNSCTASGGWTGTEATSGSMSVSPTTTTTYVLTCTGAGGASASDSATVTVTPPVRVISATYIGGTSGVTVPLAMAEDSAFNLYITGTTSNAASFPKTGTQVCSSPCPSYIAKLNYSLALQYSFGLPAASSNAIAVDSIGDAYLTGSAKIGSLKIPSADSAFQSQITAGSALTGGSHAFLLELDPNGATLFSSYIGGSGSDQGTSIALSGTSVYVAGQTTSADFPTTPDAAQTQYAGSGTGNPIVLGPQQPVSLNGDAFVVAVQNLTTDPTLAFSTYLGGSGDDYASSIAVDPFGNIVVVGSTTSVFSSSDITPLTFYRTTRTSDQGVVTTTVTPIQTASSDTLGSQLAFVYGLSSDGSAVRFLNLLGGAPGDIATGNSVAVDSAGVIYAVGATNSAKNSFDPLLSFLGSDVAVYDFDFPSSGTHVFLAEIDPTGTYLIEAALAGGTGSDQASSLALSPGFASIAGTTSSTDFFYSTHLSPLPVEAQGINEGFFVQELTGAFCNLSLTSQVGSSLIFSGPCSPGTTGGLLAGTVTDSSPGSPYTLTPTSFTIPPSEVGSVSFDLSPYTGQISLNLTFSAFLPGGAVGEPCVNAFDNNSCPVIKQGIGISTSGGGLGTIFSTTNTPLSVSVSCSSANCTYNSLPNTVLAGQTVTLSATVTSGLPNTVTWAL